MRKVRFEHFLSESTELLDRTLHYKMSKISQFKQKYLANLSHMQFWRQGFSGFRDMSYIFFHDNVCDRLIQQKPFNFVHTELQVAFIVPCDQAHSQSPHILNKSSYLFNFHYFQCFYS